MDPGTLLALLVLAAPDPDAATAPRTGEGPREDPEPAEWPLPVMPAEEAEGPIPGAAYDPATGMATWACAGNVTVTSCALSVEGTGQRDVRRPEDGACSCGFRAMAVHEGAKLELQAVVGGRNVMQRVDVNPGQAGSEARGLSCAVVAASALECGWTRGPAAPEDVSYALYVSDARLRGHRRRERRCPPRGPDACRFHDLGELAAKSYFRVAGRSARMRVRFLDAVLDAKRLERFEAPGDVVVTCNATRCRVTWARPRTWARLSFLDFRYELRFREFTGAAGAPAVDRPLVRVESQPETAFAFPSPAPRPRQEVSVRAGDARGPQWGAWSAPVAFGGDPSPGGGDYVYAAAVLASALCILGLAALGARWARTQPMCRPGPRIRDKVSGCERLPQQAAARDDDVIDVMMLRSDDGGGGGLAAGD